MNMMCISEPILFLDSLLFNHHCHHCYHHLCCCVVSHYQCNYQCCLHCCPLHLLNWYLNMWCQHHSLNHCHHHRHQWFCNSIVLIIIVIVRLCLLLLFLLLLSSSSCCCVICLNRYKHFNAGPISAVSFSYSPKTVDAE